MSEHWYELTMGEENQVNNPLLTSEEDFLGVNPYEDLVIGKRIEQWNPEAWLRSTSIEDDGDPDDVLGEHLQVPIFSPRLREALEKAGVATGDIQYLPVRVFKSTGEEIRGFCIANVITRIAALNRKNSVMLEEDESEIDPLTDMPDVKSIWKAALWGEPLKNHDVIRLAEFFPTVFVSERFAKVFREGKFTGATLDPVPVFDGSSGMIE